MSDQPKPTTGEWTVFGTSVQVNGEALFHCSTRKDAEIASLEHNAALAAEREKLQELVLKRDAEIAQLTFKLAGIDKQLFAEAIPKSYEPDRALVIETLKQQLAAERAKVRKLRCEVAAWKEPK
jgi:predicted RNase H-like nuclease (RuvC/YqgF family)